MVSNHVQSLEDRLGARLLNRTTRKVSLTEVGRAYYDRAVQILADIAQADDIAGALQSSPRGTLRVYTATHIAHFIAPIVAQFLSQHPEVRVDLTMGERNIDMIDEGFDVAVRLNAIYPHRHHLSAKVRTFIDMMASIGDCGEDCEILAGKNRIAGSEWECR